MPNWYLRFNRQEKANPTLEEIETLVQTMDGFTNSRIRLENESSKIDFWGGNDGLVMVMAELDLKLWHLLDPSKNNEEDKITLRIEGQIDEYPSNVCIPVVWAAQVVHHFFLTGEIQDIDKYHWVTSHKV